MSDAAAATTAKSTTAGAGTVDVSNDYSKWDKWAVEMDSSDEEQEKADAPAKKKEKKYDGPKYTVPKILPPTTNPTSPHYFYGMEGRQEHPPIDICGDGSVIKVITRDGNSPADWLPIEGDKCDIHYIGILEDGTKFDSRQDAHRQNGTERTPPLPFSLPLPFPLPLMTLNILLFWTHKTQSRSQRKVFFSHGARAH